MLKCWFTALLGTMLFCLAPTAKAGDFKKGDEAFSSGNYSAALKEWQPLAEQGNSSAQFALGYMYDNGTGVLKDFAEALRWYRLAAEQGDADAQTSLGTMYAFGKGVVTDFKEAVRWFRLSAEQGNGSGQLLLGTMYANGAGVPQDKVLAHMWWNISSANNNPFGPEERDGIESAMTAEQVVDALDRAKACMASNYEECE